MSQKQVCLLSDTPGKLTGSAPAYLWLRTQGTVLRVDIAVIICYFVTGDAYAKNCKAKK